MIVAATVVGDKAVSTAFRTKATTIGPQVNSLRRHYAQLMVTAIQSRIVKRTGDLASSYRVDEKGNVSSEHPAAHRHEVGFHGVDSLGRNYDDPPHAAAGPAADLVEGPLFASIEALVVEL